VISLFPEVCPPGRGAIAGCCDDALDLTCDDARDSVTVRGVESMSAWEPVQEVQYTSACSFAGTHYFFPDPLKYFPDPPEYFPDPNDYFSDPIEYFPDHLLSVDDQTVVSTSIVSLRLTIFAFSAEEIIQIVATEDLMNAQIRRTEPYPWGLQAGALLNHRNINDRSSAFYRAASQTSLPPIGIEVAISELSNGVLGRQTLGCWLVCLSDRTRRVYACLQRLGERASLTRELVRLMRPSRVDSLTLLMFQNRSESRCIALGYKCPA
jgi:hypothetical protein